MQALVLHLRSFKREVRDRSLLRVIHIRCNSCYCDYKIRNFLRYHFLCILFKSLIKKWKKVLRHSVWRKLCRVLESASYRGFWDFSVIWSRVWLKKFFWFFSRKIYYTNQNLCKRPEKGLLKTPLKTASFQRLYFTFNFTIWNVAYMLHFYFLHLQQKNRSLIRATVFALFDCVLTLMVDNGC